MSNERQIKLGATDGFAVGDLISFGYDTRPWWRRIFDWFMLRDPPVVEYFIITKLGPAGNASLKPYRRKQ